jgi:hypothetical protein
MKSTLLCLGLVALLAPIALAETKEPDARQQSADLKTLLTDVREVLPKGWRAEITPDVPRELCEVIPYRYDTPRLTIWHEEKVLARRPMINGPPHFGDDDIELEFKMETPKFDLVIVPYLSDEAYEKVVAENARRQHERLAFEEKLIPSMGSHGERPEAPTFYHPATDADKELVRQYTLLWTRTKLQSLPTHHYRALSLMAHDLNPYLSLRLHDEKLDAENEKLRETISKLLTEYPQRPLPDRP